jgi:transposase
MVKMVEKAKVIELKQENLSNREVARQTGLNRETVSKYWAAYRIESAELTKRGVDTKTIQEKLTEQPKYDAKGRRPRKYTEEAEERLLGILESEKQKDRDLGEGHKQRMTNKQIRDALAEKGHDLSQATINIKLGKLRNRQKQVFIRQQYDFGDRLEYDFGEVRLLIGGVAGTYHMAVFASPAGKFRWCKLYTNQKKPVFMDSHVKFFEFMRGGYREVVYDNMRNVVKKFIGKNEKELNEDLIKMSLYYGFSINVTNCFSGNEKGTVEKSVDVLRTELFAVNYSFNTLDDAQVYVTSRLLKLNENSLVFDEKAFMTPYKPPLELADISTAKVDKTSLISVDTVKYSVPEQLVGRTVTVKKYHDEIRVFADNTEVCRHRRAFGNGTMKIDIMHYLNTFLKKPGALKNSVALKSVPQLKAIFDKYYAQKPKDFIEILIENFDIEADEMLRIFKEKMSNKAEFHAVSVVRPISQIDVAASFMLNYSMLVMGGERA